MTFLLKKDHGYDVVDRKYLSESFTPSLDFVLIILSSWTECI